MPLIIDDYAVLLQGDGLTKVEAEALRETLIQGYRWILVDEYQDIGAEEYALIAAVAGRSLEDPDQRLRLFAVGDDDQNIYAFAGASIEFIRRFETDYAAKPSYLVENYRSTKAIISAANRVIAPAANRMKNGHDIAIDRARAGLNDGGQMEALDPVAKGRVQVLQCAGDHEAQATAAIDELVRLSQFVPDWTWSNAAVIAREWRHLEPIRSYCETRAIPVQLATEIMPPLWRLREARAYLAFLRAQPSGMLTVEAMRMFISSQPANRWWQLIADAVGAVATELGDKAAPVSDIIELFSDWARDARQEQRGLMLLTAHRAKGLEFDDIVILDGGWDRCSDGEDHDAPRRLFYVAMTRARRSLSIISMGKRHPIVQNMASTVLHRTIAKNPEAASQCSRRYQTPDPKMVDLSWVGRQAAHHPAHAALARIRTGEPIDLVEANGHWFIRDRNGVTIGRMAKSYRPPRGLRSIHAEAGAIIHWRRIDSGEEFHHLIRHETWDVVLPELTFAP